jgi:ABC-type lipoprotein export system ATPase subunit
MTDTPVVELRGVSKEYPELHVTALHDVSLRIGQGEVVAIRGPSGSGKSSLLNILGCLDRPTRGAYLLGGRDVSTLDARQQAWVRRFWIGFVFQSFQLLAEMTALENVALPLYYAGVRRRERLARARTMLERVGLGDRLEHRPPQMSGGQRQRAAIARACILRPRLLLADEPTGALDTQTGREVLGLLQKLHDEEATTLVLVTHEAEVAEAAERQVFMRDGRLVEGARGHGA